MDNGIKLEYRVFRLLFHCNYFARRSIPLRNYLYPDTLDVTDIDVIGLRYNVDFSSTKILADCKSNVSGKAIDSKPANRILWLSGLKKFLDYDIAYLCKPHINRVMKDFALSNGIIPMDEGKLTELETKFNINDVWQGSYNIQKHSDIIEYYNRIKNNPNLNHLYWFLRIEFWALPCNLQIKRCMYYFENCFGDRDLAQHEKYLLGELYILSSISLLNICKDVYPYTRYERETWITNKMIEGLGTVDQQDKILSLIKQITEAKVEEITQQKVPIYVGGYSIPPPEYTIGLIEVVDRLLDKAEYSIEIPRFLDFFIYEYGINNSPLNRDYLSGLINENLDIIAKLAKNILRFVDPFAERRAMNKNLFDF